MNIEVIKRAQSAHGYSNKRLAEITGVHESTFSRYLSGEVKDVPFDVVAKLASYLEISLDEIAGNPPSSQSDELYEHIKELYESKLEDKQEQCDDLKGRVQDLRKRLDRKTAIITAQWIAMIFVAGFALYWVLDALNGDWGRIRYELYASHDIWQPVKDMFTTWFTT